VIGPGFEPIGTLPFRPAWGLLVSTASPAPWGDRPPGCELLPGSLWTRQAVSGAEPTGPVSLAAIGASIIESQWFERRILMTIANAIAATDLAAQIAFFRANSYVVLPDLLSPDLVAEMNEAIDRDHAAHGYFWDSEVSRNGTSNLLLTEPIFEKAVHHPTILPIVQALMGGPVCFEELSVQITRPSDQARPTGWHRDRGHWMDHPLHLDYPQVIYYLSDVDEDCHHFTISPEPADGEVLDTADQLARGGSFAFRGRAGTGILFNAATLHGVTIQQTNRERRIMQVYYGHQDRPSLAEVTLMPPRLWRDHPDPEIRRFYGKLNRYTRDMLRWLGATDEQEDAVS
jgi:hypothetical protein